MKDEIIKLINQAGKILLDRFSNDIFLKSDNYDFVSLVSEADLESEKLIIKGLETLFPNDNIFSEEKGLIEKGSNRTWYVDPLDGTSNYIRQIPIWGISIGLVESGVPVFGVISLPPTQQIIYAEKNKGAFVGDKKINVSKRLLKESLYYGRAYYQNKLYLDTKIGGAVGLVKVVDSSTFELAQIALGNAEIYSLINVPHDVVAGVVIIREAGGKVTDFDGSQWTINSKWVVATNGIIHDEVLNLRDVNLYT